MRGIFKRSFSGFEPIDDNAKSMLKKYKFGDEAEIEIKQKRNVKFHRLFFAMINLTYNNQDITDDRNDFREAVIIHAGYYRLQKQIDGSEIKRAESISFAKMDNITFSELYSKVFDVCLKILGCKSEELEDELLRFN